jgi:hypothetical protein
VLTSQSRTVASSPQLASRQPSLDSATPPHTSLWPFNVANGRPVGVSQTRTMLSPPPLATR